MARGRNQKTKGAQLVGVIHLPALPGALTPEKWSAAEIVARAGEQAVHEALIFERAGFDSVIIENFGDAPFFGAQVPAETTAALAVLATAVASSIKIPLGVNVLRNDALAALAVAAVSGSEFIRVNVLSGVAATDQGMIQGQAATLLRRRAELSSPVQIWADVWVKHAVTLSSTSLDVAIEDTAVRAGADAIILSGETTGRSVELDKLQIAARAAHRARVPLYIGSGATAESVSELLHYADGIIVSSSLRQGRRAGAPLDPRLVRDFVKAARPSKRPSDRRSSTRRPRK